SPRIPDPAATLTPQSPRSPTDKHSREKNSPPSGRDPAPAFRNTPANDARTTPAAPAANACSPESPPPNIFPPTPPTPAATPDFPASLSSPIFVNPPTLATLSALVRIPTFSSIVACAIDPMMSCFQRRQSKEIDSVNRATSSAGPVANRPLRETGDFFFMQRA